MMGPEASTATRISRRTTNCDEDGIRIIELKGAKGTLKRNVTLPPRGTRLGGGGAMLALLQSNLRIEQLSIMRTDYKRCFLHFCIQTIATTDPTIR
uniref:Uncharacterized protein n=1 Tax=Ascaris lumbricoides TaxID=6252 RepID=A0A9J2PHI1_ASCLU